MKTVLTATLMSLMLMTGAHAQAVTVEQQENCMAEMGKLDVNGDGYVDSNEMAEYGTAMANVDADGDGRVSPDERVVACKNEEFVNVFEAEN